MRTEANVIDAAKVYNSALVENVKNELKAQQPLILDLNSVSAHQADIIYNKLDIAGFDVKIPPDNRKSQIEVNYKQ
jgi:SepF-like predicted cell division protein (DUF552 family)